MTQYRSESHLSRHLCKWLRAHGFMVQRIESHSTGLGIPDLFVCRDTNAWGWIELKLVKHDYLNQFSSAGLAQIHWRPGQQLWQRAMNNKIPESAMTLIAYRNVYVLYIPRGKTEYSASPYHTFGEMFG